MDSYAIIEYDYTSEGTACFLKYGYGKDRFVVSGGMQDFARIIRLLGIREIKIYATDNKPIKGGLCFTTGQAAERRTDLYTTLITDSITPDNKMKRGKKIWYSISLLDPYTCEESDPLKFSI